MKNIPNRLAVTAILFFSFVFSACSGSGYTTVIKPLEGECWWGGIINDGHHQPYFDSEPLDLSVVNKGGATVPFLLSSCGRYVWSERPFTYSFSNGVMTVVSKSEKLTPVLAGSTLKEAYLAACKKHFPFCGVTPPEEFLSKPQFNNWIEIFLRGTNQQVVDEYTDAIAANGFPCGVYMMDGGYQSRLGAMEFEPKLFPDPEGMFRKIHTHGWKALLWMVPFVSPDSREYKQLRYHEKLPTEDALVHRKDSRQAAVVRWWSGISALFDLTSPKGRKSYIERLQAFMRNYGFDGFKFDAGDPGHMMSDGGDYSLYLPEQEAVDYTREYSRLSFEFPYNEFRAGFKCGGWPIVLRLQDKAHSWEQLKWISPHIQTSGLMGCPYVVGDMVGGGMEVSFVNVELDHKLFVRSCELQALMPMMQFSLAPWRVLTKEECDICREMANLHVRMSPYILELARNAAQTGEPIVRSMEYEFPHQGFNRQMQQFMLGSKYLVAPVLDPDDCVEVELPCGKWKDDMGNEYTGPQILELTAVPLGRLPYFEKI